MNDTNRNITVSHFGCKHAQIIKANTQTEVTFEVKKFTVYKHLGGIVDVSTLSLKAEGQESYHNTQGIQPTMSDVSRSDKGQYKARIKLIMYNSNDEADYLENDGKLHYSKETRKRYMMDAIDNYQVDWLSDEEEVDTNNRKSKGVVLCYIIKDEAKDEVLGDGVFFDSASQKQSEKISKALSYLGQIINSSQENNLKTKPIVAAPSKTISLILTNEDSVLFANPHSASIVYEITNKNGHVKSPGKTLLTLDANYSGKKETSTILFSIGEVEDGDTIKIVGVKYNGAWKNYITDDALEINDLYQLQSIKVSLMYDEKEIRKFGDSDENGEVYIDITKN